MLSTWFRPFVILAICLTAVPAFSADEKKGKKGEQQWGPLTQTIAKIDGFNLADDVKTKVSAIVEEFKPKFAEAVKKTEGNLSEEQKKAVHDALKQAKQDGKKGKDLKQIIDDAAKLSDEQKKAKEEGLKSLGKLSHDLKKALTGVLTAEQVGELALDGKKKAKS
jgi:hypothetical protein